MLEFKKNPKVEKGKRYYNSSRSNNNTSYLTVTIPIPGSSWFSFIFWWRQEPLVFTNASFADGPQKAPLPATDNCGKEKGSFFNWERLIF